MTGCYINSLNYLRDNHLVLKTLLISLFEVNELIISSLDSNKIKDKLILIIIPTKTFLILSTLE